MAVRGLLKALQGFHASPHKFDKVNIKANLGKGEGAQVYGNGFYIAEAEPTMESYYNIFKSQRAPFLYKGKPVDVMLDDSILERWPEAEKMSARDRERFVSIMGSLGNQAHADQKYIDIMRENFAPGSGGWDRHNKQMLSFFDKKVAPHLEFPPPPQAHRYEMAMATDDTKLLDWDKQLGDQPDEIFDAVRDYLQPQHERFAAQRKATLDRGTDFRGRPLKPRDIERLTSAPEALDEYTGEQAYKAMGLIDDAGSPAMDQKQGYQLAADRLHAAGIDGTKYLDQLSRPSMGNEGFPVKNPTYNYAIWNDEIITILRRYGLPITGAGLATLAAALDQQPETA